MKPRHSLRVLCGTIMDSATIIGIVPHGCVINASVSFILSSYFQSEGNYAFVNTADSMGRRQMKKKFPLLQACLRGGGGGEGGK